MRRSLDCAHRRPQVPGARRRWGGRPTPSNDASTEWLVLSEDLRFGAGRNQAHRGVGLPLRFAPETLQVTGMLVAAPPVPRHTRKVPKRGIELSRALVAIGGRARHRLFHPLSEGLGDVWRKISKPRRWLG